MAGHGFTVGLHRNGGTRREAPVGGTAQRPYTRHCRRAPTRRSDGADRPHRWAVAGLTSALTEPAEPRENRRSGTPSNDPIRGFAAKRRPDGGRRWRTARMAGHGVTVGVHRDGGTRREAPVVGTAQRPYTRPCRRMQARWSDSAEVWRGWPVEGWRPTFTATAVPGEKRDATSASNDPIPALPPSAAMGVERCRVIGRGAAGEDRGSSPAPQPPPARGGGEEWERGPC